MPRSISELIRLKLERVAIPSDEGGEQLFTELNPGYIADQATQAELDIISPIVAGTNVELHTLHEHFHNDESWWGALAAPNETNAIDMNVNRPFVAISGNNAWGAGISVIGSSDNPGKLWQTLFDMHRILVTDPGNATPWRLRFLYGDQSLEEAAQASRWTEVMFLATGVGANVDTGPIEVRMPLLPVGWRVWAQAWNATNLVEVDFFIGVHGYPVLEYVNE